MAWALARVTVPEGLYKTENMKNRSSYDGKSAIENFYIFMFIDVLRADKPS